MSRALAHRGPDADGLARRGPAVLAHRRLSIIDTGSAANQPMDLPEAGLTIVFNGEIYNFAVLRTVLEGRGHHFQTHSDTEVLLHAFAEWGTGCLERLVGMFAFAVWDQRRRVLTLARDRLGKKPLFFALRGEGIAFASELKALRLHPFVDGSISSRAVSQFLSLGYVLGDACILDGVEKLGPGEVLEVGEAHVERRSYWNLAAHFQAKRRFTSRDAAMDELGELIDTAVRDRMVSDVPLGAFLSGGLDSAMAVEAMARSGRLGGIETFTIGFSERGYSEAAEARISADALGVRNHAHHVDAAMAGILPAMVHAADEPFADTSMIPLWFLSEFARRHVTVCLSGDGGDEAFGGYVTYAADRIHQMTRWIPGWAAASGGRILDAVVPATHAKVGWDYKARQFLAGHPLPFPQAHYSWRTLFEGDAKTALLHPDRRAAVLACRPFDSFARHFQAVEGCHYLDQAMYVDIKTWLADDILVKVDRMTMAHSLEARAPLLDHRVVEFAAALPVDWKLRGLTTKYILKEAARRRLPARVIDRRKAGFNAPVAHWLNGGLAELARGVTLGGPLLE
ncbi:asparagine synthase, glutamine-hydrolyzing [Paramagnetospirillum caucaseum]|uniref:asparagine synthase (glutamine-hydrolyzing) n=2 Tax=Paramagnetospirillum caucaseum TaxID=1244869 RepID=M3A956_9PROT|nr:asparagine synthase, glutamine-hydrolyzing [Paramagnetospirillum caucaseum]